MQSELRLRLLKDEEIVGQKWTLTLDDASGYVSFMEYNDPSICADLSGDSLVDIYLYAGEEEWIFGAIDYDSFELGIKVGEEWWFEGDIVQRGTHKYELIYNSDSGGWLLKVFSCDCTGANDCPTVIRFSVGLMDMNICDKTLVVDKIIYKRIGNIHKEK